jgi:hypothetical protein
VRTRYLAPFFCALMAITLAACGGGGANPNPPAAISISFGATPPASLAAGAKSNISAVVSDDSTNAGVSWSVSCSSSACGSITPTTSASGASVTYSAPSSAPSPASVTIIAKAVADTTKSVSASATITGPQPTSVSFATAPPTSLVVNTSASVAAKVSSDTKNAGVSWSLSCGSSACGSIGPTTSASGASVTYTAPSAVPSPATVTITATSVTDTTKSVAGTVTITTAPPPVLADGTYVYHLSGQDNYNNYYVAGAFNIKNGVITGGEQDYSDGEQSAYSQLVPSGSSISQSGNTIEVVLATPLTSFGISGVVTLHGTPVSSTRVLVSEFDSFAAATGSIDLQTSAAASGGYAFVINGIDGEGNQLAIGGVINLSGENLSTSNSVFDYTDGGTILLAQSFASGSASAPDSFGRVTVTLTPSQASGVSPFIVEGYVTGNTVQLVEDGSNDSLNADLGGTALAQGANAPQFSASSIENATYVYSAEGQDTNGPVGLGGAFVFAPGGTATGLMVFNDLTNNNGNSFSGASYRVDVSGRVSIWNIIPSSMQNISMAFELYLDGNGNGLVLGADNVQQTGGLAYQQNGLNDYEGNYAINVRGFLNGPNYEQPYGAVGPVSIATDNVTGSTEYTSQDPNLRPSPSLTPFDNYTNASLTGTEDMTNGLFHLNGLNSLGFSGSSGFGIYPVDGNRLLAIEVDDGATGILMLENTTQLESH